MRTKKLSATECYVLLAECDRRQNAIHQARHNLHIEEQELLARRQRAYERMRELEAAGKLEVRRDKPAAA